MHLQILFSFSRGKNYPTYLFTLLIKLRGLTVILDELINYCLKTVGRFLQ